MTAIVNLLMFIPYFFSVIELLKTYFAPWKGILSPESTTSWSIEVQMRRLADNFASRLVGSMVRGSILIAFVFVQVGFILSIPFVLIGVFLSLPLAYMFYTLMPSEKEQRIHAFNNFMKRHIVDLANHQKIVEWFEIYYANTHKGPWWSIQRLFTQPPLGRDLTTGYTNTLDKFSTELTLQKPHHKHLIGRTRELNIIQQILAKTNQANVLLTGENGVGKNAIIEAVAKATYEGSIHKNLAYKRILEVDLDSVLSQVTDYIQRESVIAQLFDEAARARNIVLVIKNIERFISSDDGHIDLTTVIAKYAHGDKIQFIATTTPYMYQKFIFPNKEISSLFEKVDVHMVTPEQAIRILMDVAPDIEARHSVYIAYEALVAAVHGSERYMIGQSLPEKAIELLDEAAVLVKASGTHTAVDAHIINLIIEQHTHVPTELSEKLRNKLLHLEDKLKERVLFQDQAINALGVTLRKAFTTLMSRRKPLATMLFLGPTGVGKTETAKATSAIFFDSENTLLRLDMSNFQRTSDISKLIGSIETNEPGILTEMIRNHSYGTLLLDELEKAHPDLLNIFLTILDEGYFTDGFGKRVDCSHLIVIATSNAGADFIYKSLAEGTIETDITTPLIEHLINSKIYSPEFLNRFDGVVVYKPLYKDSMKVIAERMLDTIKVEAFKQYKATLEFSPSFIDKLVQTGYDPKFGARNMQRLIRDRVEDTLSKMILQGTIAGKTLQF